MFMFCDISNPTANYGIYDQNPVLEETHALQSRLFIANFVLNKMM